MFCKSYCAAIIGIEACIVQIEVDVNDGLPLFQLVGCLNSEVKEAKERVRSAIKNIGWRLPPKRITVNISPADIRKDGTQYDLGIAVALLKAFGYFSKANLKEILFAGELSLDGHVNPVNGILPIVIAAKENNFKYCIVPKANLRECTIIDGIYIIGVSSLAELVKLIEEEALSSHAVECDEWKERTFIDVSEKNFSEVVGQTMIKRAAMIAIAGGHNMLMQGPPGAGKTMIAERIPGIMPPLTKEESLEIAKIKSISNLKEKNDGFIYERPFRMPHHSIPPTGLIGGGANPKAGEISLAHKGVLFLDELTEFNRNTIELLRIPLEKRKIIHSRNSMSVEYPCDFTLVTAMNPCPCGYFPNKLKCTCTPLQIKRYIGKISYALLDRIDIIAQVQPVEFKNICKDDYVYEESTEYMQERIMEVVDIQKKRFCDYSFDKNAQMTKRCISKFCRINKVTTDYLKKIYDNSGISARGFYKVLKIARTIADFDKKESIEMHHVAEAVMYRSIDRNFSLNYEEEGEK